jgi:hypothetical protein
VCVSHSTATLAPVGLANSRSFPLLYVFFAFFVGSPGLRRQPTLQGPLTVQAKGPGPSIGHFAAQHESLLRHFRCLVMRSAFPMHVCTRQIT